MTISLDRVDIDNAERSAIMSGIARLFWRS